MSFDQAKLQQAIGLLKSAESVVALTGAGMSTASGIPDFRSQDSGLWNGVDPFIVASLPGFQANPQKFYDWVHPLAEVSLHAQPNAGHIALARMEQNGPLTAVITQNIDELHTRAGSQTVYEVHGNMRFMQCLRCELDFDSVDYWPAFVNEKIVPTCSCGKVLKPKVILFGENLPVGVWWRAEESAEKCNVMIIAGSSMEVYPAAGLPERAKRNGAKIIIVNQEPTAVDHLADIIFHHDLTELLPLLAEPFNTQ